MVRTLDNTRHNVNVTDVVVGYRVSNEDSIKVMLVQLSSAFARLFDADRQAKYLEMFEVWLLLQPPFKGSCPCSTMNSPVVEISHV